MNLCWGKIKDPELTPLKITSKVPCSSKEFLRQSSKLVTCLSTNHKNIQRYYPLRDDSFDNEKHLIEPQDLTLEEPMMT